MTLEYKNFPGKRTEMTKEDFNSLTKTQKNLFKIIDENDSPKIKQQMISNMIGTGANKTKSEAPKIETPKSKPGQRAKRIES